MQSKLRDLQTIMDKEATITFLSEGLTFSDKDSSPFAKLLLQIQIQMQMQMQMTGALLSLRGP